MNNNSKSIISIILLLLISCSNGSKKNDDNSGKKVFLELVLSMSKQDAISQMNTLVKKGKIQKSEAFINFTSSDIYEYPFFIKTTDFTSFFSLGFSSNNLLKSVRIEIQDPSKQIHIEDIYKLLAKKYGNASDTIFTYFNYNLNDPYKIYSWEKLNGLKISLERKYLSSYIRKIGDISNESNTNYFLIEYTDLELSNLDSEKVWRDIDKKIEEGQKKIENDL